MTDIKDTINVDGNITATGKVQATTGTANNELTTKKYVDDADALKLDDSQLVAAWQVTPDDTHIASEKLTKDSLDAKLDDSQLVTSWSGTVLDTNIPSEKLTKNSLDGKVDKLVTKPTAGTYTSVTINAEGQVTAGSNPTTLAGYGITDAVDLSSAQTITNIKTFTRPNNTNGLIILKREGADSSSTITNATISMVTNGGDRGIINNWEDGITVHTQLGAKGNTQYQIQVNSQKATAQGWAESPYRSYASANIGDIVTIGSLAINPNVVHTTGNETVAGDKTFSNFIYLTNTKSSVRAYQSTDTRSTVLSSISPNGTYEARLYLNMKDNGSIELVIGKWINGGYSTQTVVATL